MFIRVKKSPNTSKRAVQIVESYRIDGKVRQRIVQHVGMAQDDEELARLRALAESIKKALEEKGTLPLYAEGSMPSDSSAASADEQSRQQEKRSAYDVNLRNIVEEKRRIVGIHDVYGKLYDDLGFDRIIGNPARNRGSIEALKEMVLARIARPRSKRGSVEDLMRHFDVQISLKRVYDMMDKLDDKAIERIKQRAWQATRTLLNDKVDVIYFDATTLYFECFEEDELRQTGYSKDGKFNQPQVVLALMVTKEGLPVGYELFEGSTFDGHTLIPSLASTKAHFEVDKVVYVADMGMFSKQNRQALEKLEKENVTYIVGARIKNMPQSLQEEMLDLSRYRAINDDLSVATFMYESKKLLVTHSKKRAKKDALDRQKGIDRLKKRLQKSDNPKAQLSDRGYKKFLELQGEHSCKIALNETKIEEAAKWDGLKGILSNDTALSDEEIIHQYTNLWQIEESFRITKHDLRIRPVYHFKPERVKAHIAITFIAYTLVRHLTYRVKHQYESLSPETIRQSLLDVQQSILLDTQTNRRFILPSAMPVHAEKIYRLMGLKPLKKAKLM